MSGVAPLAGSVEPFTRRGSPLPARSRKAAGQRPTPAGRALLALRVRRCPLTLHVDAVLGQGFHMIGGKGPPDLCLSPLSPVGVER